MPSARKVISSITRFGTLNVDEVAGPFHLHEAGVGDVAREKLGVCR